MCANADLTLADFRTLHTTGIREAIVRHSVFGAR